MQREDTIFEVVTGDEKWTIYNNVERKRSWGKRNELPLAIPKADLHPKKVMLCVWWDWKGILYYELLPNNETINSEKYCFQLDELKTAIEQKRPEIANRKSSCFIRIMRGLMCASDNSTKVVGARLGCSISSTIFTRPRAF